MNKDPLMFYRDTNIQHHAISVSILGRGVFASMSIDKGCFILEYRGELLSKGESQIRQNIYNETENTFLFDFDWNGRQWW